MEKSGLTSNWDSILADEQLTPEPNTAPADGAPSEVSLEDIDTLLKQEDPNFETAIKELSEIKPETADLESESLDIEDGLLHPSPESHSTEAATAPQERPRRTMRERWDLVHLWARDQIRFVHYTWVEFRHDKWGTLKNLAISLFQTIRGLLSWTLEVVSEGLDAFRKLTWRARIGLLLAVVFLGGGGYAVRFAMQGGRLPLSTERYITNLAKVADDVEIFDPEEGFLDFYASSNQPQFFLALEKVVVNLKPSTSSSSNPMGAFKFYIEGSSQEVTVEIKDREREIRDLIQRTLEDMPYDQLVTQEGKQKAKITLRQKINGILSKGRVRRVLFDTVVLKP